jgi:hypothetical protein
VLLAIFSWFTIVFTREHRAGIRRYTLFYLRWRVRGLAYVMLLADGTRRSTMALIRYR